MTEEIKREKEIEKIIDVLDDIIEKHTAPTGHGADYTDSQEVLKVFADYLRSSSLLFLGEGKKEGKTPEQIYNEHTKGWDDYRPLTNIDCISMMKKYHSQFSSIQPSEMKLPTDEEIEEMADEHFFDDEQEKERIMKSDTIEHESMVHDRKYYIKGAMALRNKLSNSSLLAGKEQTGKEEKCMNCTKEFDLNEGGCICPDCFLSDDWVKVEERLPADGEMYLVIDPNEHYEHKQKVARFSKFRNKWFTDGSDEVYPTHWRELPPAPTIL